MRLTLWFFVISLLILLIFSLGTYWGMQKLLFEALDKQLDVLSNSFERSYDPFKNRFSEIDYFKANEHDFPEYYLEVYNSDSNPIYFSPLSSRLSLDISLPAQLVEVGFTVRIKVKKKIPTVHPDSQGEVTFRLFTRPMFYHGRHIGWIVVGLSIERIEEAMEHLLNVLLASILVSLALLAFTGFILTRKALEPVNIITKKANLISQSNLEERIPVAVENDELGQLSKVLNDLLDRLHRAFTTQQQFLADAAHELKTPLSVLRVHWEGELNNPELSLEMKGKLVQDIETISRLSHLINNLLLLSKTEAIRSTFEFEPVQLDQLIMEVLSDAQVLATMKKQQIEVVDIQPILVNGDRMRLYQLIFNILDNAIGYSPPASKIWITLRPDKEWNIIEIRDNGPGISSDDLPFIFDRFYRAQKDRARKTGGSGLGLSICQLIARSHDGEIEVESEYGKGTTFRIKLPDSIHL